MSSHLAMLCEVQLRTSGKTVNKAAAKKLLENLFKAYTTDFLSIIKKDSEIDWPSIEKDVAATVSKPDFHVEKDDGLGVAILMWEWDSAFKGPDSARNDFTEIMNNYGYDTQKMMKGAFAKFKAENKLSGGVKHNVRNHKMVGTGELEWFELEILFTDGSVIFIAKYQL